MNRRTVHVKLGRIALAMGAVLLVATAAACGSSTSNSDKSATAAAKAPANPTAAATKASTAGNASPTAGQTSSSGSTTPAGGGAQKTLTITAKDFSFSADSLDVSKGDTIAITFKNTGQATHTLTFYEDDAHTTAIAGADTGSVSGGATKTLSVTAGTGLYYRCNIHPTQMEGEIEIN